MLMTRSSRLAIEALIELADLGSQRWITSERLSRNTTGDLPFVQQILNRLVGNSILLSKQGRGGGYQLACDPKKLTLRAVIDGIEGVGVQKCLLDSTDCDGWRKCRLAPTWHPIREKLASFLGRRPSRVSLSAVVVQWIGLSGLTLTDERAAGQFVRCSATQRS